MLSIPEIDAKRYVSRLIADGVLKPNPLLQTSVSEIVKTIDSSPLDKVSRRLDMKAQTEPEQLEARDPADTIECLDDRVVAAEDEPAEEETQAPEEEAAINDRLTRTAAPGD